MRLLDPLGLRSLRDGLSEARSQLSATTEELTATRSQISQLDAKVAGARQRTARAFAAGYGRGRMHRDLAAGDTGRLAADWSTASKRADAVVHRFQRIVRARSRTEYFNSGWVRKFCSLLEQNMVGSTGVSLQARIRDENGEPDVAACQIIEGAWAAWWGTTLCDSRRMQDGVGHETQAARQYGLDGEIVAVTDFALDAGAPTMSLRIVDPELLDINRNQDLGGGRRIRLGVETDPIGRPVAYHFSTDPATYDSSPRGSFSGKAMRIEAERVIHSFYPDLPGQSRGLPWTMAGLWDAHMLDEYGGSALTAARIGAEKSVWIKDTGGRGYTGEGTDESGNQIAPSSAGELGTLTGTQSLEPWSPEYPRGEMPGFVKLYARKMSAAYGVLYNSLANDLEGVNYSSLRFGSQEEREAWKIRQAFFILSFYRQVYVRWLRFMLQWGNLVIPTKNGPRPLAMDQERRFHAVHLQGRRWDWVDPLKDWEAVRIALELNATTLTQVIRERGGDPTSLWDERAREIEYLKGKGLNPDVSAVKGAATALLVDPSEPAPKEDTQDGSANA